MKDIKEEIEKIKEFRRQFYNSHANDYENTQHADNDEDFLQEFKGFKKLVRVKPGQFVLDIATGTGTYLIQMARSGALCYGIDQSPKILEQLKVNFMKENLESNLKDIHIGVADKLPHPDAFFNWVTCIGMFEYYPLEYVKIVLSEAIRVLKPEGNCFFDIADPYKKYAQERDWIFSYDLDKFRRMIETLNFKILTQNKAGYMLQYLLSMK
ncbi:MAG: class I SAM-dependent methyltransferase [Candidatus Lokiarchaeota archaeon]|nr:class I SAM-dependent methyltransferase [Candidatus Lokiarchaeota archaeon]